MERSLFGAGVLFPFPRSSRYGALLIGGAAASLSAQTPQLPPPIAVQVTTRNAVVVSAFVAPGLVALDSRSAGSTTSTDFFLSAFVRDPQTRGAATSMYRLTVTERDGVAAVDFAARAGAGPGSSGAAASAFVSPHEHLVRFTPSFAMDVKLVLRWTGRGSGTGRHVLKVDVFDDGVFEIDSNTQPNGEAVVHLPPGWVRPFEVAVHSSVEARGGMGAADFSFIAGIHPTSTTERNVPPFGCSEGAFLSVFPRLDGGIDIRHHTYRWTLARTVIFGAPLQRPVPLSSLSPFANPLCAVNVDIGLVVPLPVSCSIAGLRVTSGVGRALRPLTLGVQALTLDHGPVLDTTDWHRVDFR